MGEWQRLEVRSQFRLEAWKLLEALEEIHLAGLRLQKHAERAGATHLLGPINAVWSAASVSRRELAERLVEGAP